MKIMSAKQLKTLALIVGVMSLVFCTSVFQGCQKDDLLMESSIKEKILLLGEKYGLTLNLNNFSQGNISNINSIEELELIFQNLCEQRKNGAKMKIKFDKRIGNKFFATSINDSLQKSSLSLRLKSSNIESLEEWFYDLTWFNVSLSYDKNGSSISNVSVNSFYTGTSLYSFTQTSSNTSANNGTITFQIYGNETHVWTVMGVTFSETRAIHASGSYNTNTNTGDIDLSGNGYWFQ